MKIGLFVAMLLVVGCGRDSGYYHSHPYHRGPNAPHDFHNGHPTNQIINECGSNYTITPYVEDADGTTVNVFCGERVPQYPINWGNWQYAHQYQWQGMQYYFWY